MQILFAALVGVLGSILLSLFLSWPVYLLWNSCLVGAIDGVHNINWETAWGISMLCSLLFKNNEFSSK